MSNQRHGLGDQERAVLAAVTANPFVGQQEIADGLGLARSTVAAHIASLSEKGYILGRGYILPTQNRVVCIGGAVLDRKYRAMAPLLPATSNPVEGYRSFGGVARNVAENLAALGVTTSFVSVVGRDETGRAIVDHLAGRGVDVSQISMSTEAATAEYVALLDPTNNLSVAAADMRILDFLNPELIDRIWAQLAGADWVFADCNLSAGALAYLIEKKRSARFKLAIDAVSTPKVARLPGRLDGIDLIVMNQDEALSFHEVKGHNANWGAPAVTAALNVARTGLNAPKSALSLHKLGATAVVVTLGPNGAVFAESGTVGHVDGVPARPVDITGAGDAMIAATLHRLLAGDGIEDALRVGALLGALTTETTATVHPALSQSFLALHHHRIPLPAAPKDPSDAIHQA